MVKIQLNSISVNLSLSQETTCYSAKLFADGNYVATVGNDGHGGCDRILGLAPGLTYRDLDALETRVKAEFPKEDLFGDGNLTEQTLEGVCHELVSTHLIEKELTRMFKSKVVFFEKGLPADDKTAPLMSIAARKPIAPNAIDQIIARLRVTDPQAYILNAVPREDAIKAYRRAG